MIHCVNTFRILHSQIVRAMEQEFWEKVHLPPPIIFRMSCVMCQESHVRCLMSHFWCIVSIIIWFLVSIFLDKVVKLGWRVEGLLSTRLPRLVWIYSTMMIMKISFGLLCLARLDKECVANLIFFMNESPNIFVA